MCFSEISKLCDRRAIVCSRSNHARAGSRNRDFFVASRVCFSASSRPRKMLHVVVTVYRCERRDAKVISTTLEHDLNEIIPVSIPGASFTKNNIPANRLIFTAAAFSLLKRRVPERNSTLAGAAQEIDLLFSRLFLFFFSPSLPRFSFCFSIPVSFFLFVIFFVVRSFARAKRHSTCRRVRLSRLALCRAAQEIDLLYLFLFLFARAEKRGVADCPRAIFVAIMDADEPHSLLTFPRLSPPPYPTHPTLPHSPHHVYTHIYTHTAAHSRSSNSGVGPRFFLFLGRCCVTLCGCDTLHLVQPIYVHISFSSSRSLATHMKPTLRLFYCPAWLPR